MMELLTELRIPSHLVAPLFEGIASPGWRESAVFGLAARVPLGDKSLLLVQKVIPLPDDAYIPDAAHGAKWKGSAMLNILNEAMARNLGIVIFHAHDHSGPVGLSEDDLRSARDLLPRFLNLVPSRAHASVVLGCESAAGIVLDPRDDRFHTRMKVRLLGKKSLTLRTTS